MIAKSQNYWNPFRDWNDLAANPSLANAGLKTTETLLGIEMSLSNVDKLNAIAGLKTTETLLGIETKNEPF